MRRSATGSPSTGRTEGAGRGDDGPRSSMARAAASLATARATAVTSHGLRTGSGRARVIRGERVQVFDARQRALPFEEDARQLVGRSRASSGVPRRCGWDEAVADVVVDMPRDLADRRAAPPRRSRAALRPQPLHHRVEHAGEAPISSRRRVAKDASGSSGHACGVRASSASGRLSRAAMTDASASASAAALRRRRATSGPSAPAARQWLERRVHHERATVSGPRLRSGCHRARTLPAGAADGVCSATVRRRRFGRTPRPVPRASRSRNAVSTAVPPSSVNTRGPSRSSRACSANTSPPGVRTAASAPESPARATAASSARPPRRTRCGKWPELTRVPRRPGSAARRAPWRGPRSPARTSGPCARRPERAPQAVVRLDRLRHPV